MCQTYNIVFLLKIVQVTQGFLRLHINFRMDFSISAKNIIGVLMEIALNLQTTLDDIYILTVLNLPVHEYEISFRLCVSISSFSNVLQFSVYKSFVSLINFIPVYFILFLAIINEIVFLILFLFSCLNVVQSLKLFNYLYILCPHKIMEILYIQMFYSYSSNQNKIPITILVPLKTQNPELGGKNITSCLHKTHRERRLKILLGKHSFPTPK